MIYSELPFNMPIPPDEAFYERKDSRKYFGKNQLLLASCKTVDTDFNEYIQDLSSGGAFIQTKKKLTIGQEIAMTISLPNSRKALKATGEIVRVSPKGVGVEFKIIFNY
jgi:Tfp pilus assembly protein PilZ